MRLLWDLYWPIMAAALVIGVIAGMVGFGPVRVRSSAGSEEVQAAVRSRRRIRWLSLLAGIVMVLLVTGLWHAFGAADRFRTQVETAARITLDDYEMTQIAGRLEQGPSSRTLVLSSPADDFQRRELVRIIGEIPGVWNVRWAGSRTGESFRLPLLVEVELWALVAFSLGLLLAYLIELRRRARAEWRW